MEPNLNTWEPFADRREAGTELAARLHAYKDRGDVVVLALPRGGVPVAYEVARALGAPLDVFLVRKLGVPGHRELAMGAIASGGVRVLNDDIVRWYAVPASIIDEVAELKRWERAAPSAVARGLELPTLPLQHGRADADLSSFPRTGLVSGRTSLYTTARRNNTSSPDTLICWPPFSR